MKLGAGLIIQFKTTCWSIKMTSSAIDFSTLSIVNIILAGFFPVDTLIFKANSLFKYPHQPSPHHFNPTQNRRCRCSFTKTYRSLTDSQPNVRISPKSSPRCNKTTVRRHQPLKLTTNLKWWHQWEGNQTSVITEAAAGSTSNRTFHHHSRNPKFRFRHNQPIWKIMFVKLDHFSK